MGFPPWCFMSLRLQLTRTQPQEDALRRTECGSDLEYYKRVKIDGVAQTEDQTHRFEVILDMRARLLSVAMKDAPSHEMAMRVGTGLVNEMAVFVPVPVTKLLIRVRGAEPGPRAEWMTTDATHVSGLLHRIQQQGEFDSRPAPPLPDQLSRILMHLSSSVSSNLLRMQGAWKPMEYDPELALNRESVLMLDVDTWETHRPQFMELCDNDVLRQQLSSFFWGVRNFQRLWEMVVSGSAYSMGDNAPPEGWRKRLASPAERQASQLQAQLKALAEDISWPENHPKPRLE